MSTNKINWPSFDELAAQVNSGKSLVELMREKAFEIDEAMKQNILDNTPKIEFPIMKLKR